MYCVEQIALTQTGILPSLIQDYVTGKEEVKRLYRYAPAWSSFAQIIADKQKEHTDRALLAEVLQEQYADIETSARVRENLSLLRSEKTFTVTAAHQPCLFLGPLYNIWKISGAINLCEELKKQFPQNNFVPVFWMGSEDHDVAEVNHTYINGKRLEWKEGASGAVGRISTDYLRSALDELKAMQGNEYLISLLEKGIPRYRTFGKLTQFLANELFGEFGLVVLEQDHPQFKQRLSPLIADELMHQRAWNVLRENLDFLSTHYKVQAQPREINFFYLGDGFRERIVYNGETKDYQVLHRNLRFEASSLAEAVRTQPENFSPNVIIRPLYQELLLPNLAFIGGSGELSYWLQLKPLFDYYGVNYPVLLPRNGAAVLGSSAQSKLAKLGLKATAFFGDIEHLIKEYVREHASLDTSLQTEKRTVETLYEQIASKAGKIDATLRQSAATEKQKTLNALSNLENKMLKAEKRNQETAVNQIRAVHEALFPLNNLQERSENFSAFFTDRFIRDSIAQMNPLAMDFKFFANE